MGNWHCITSSCATVVYREYLPPVVRWRYEGEDWLEIEGDDYTTELIKDCSGLPHLLTYNSFTRQGWTGHTDAPFSNLRITDGNTVYRQWATIPSDGILDWSMNFNRFTTLLVYVDSPNYPNNLILNSRTRNWYLGYFGVNPDSEELCSQTCKFTITNQGIEVFTQTRSVCPEVEMLPCRLSELSQEIKIDKKPWREKIQVVGEDNRDALFGDFFEAAEKIINGNIPNNCREIWKTPVLDFFDINFVDDDFTLFAEYYQLVATVCSAKNCPPPEYQVICDCKDDCKSCPENTCAVECNGSICCYDTTTGKSVKSIPIANYCGD